MRSTRVDKGDLLRPIDGSSLASNAACFQDGFKERTLA
jgi:hypothetical protein